MNIFKKLLLFTFMRSLELTLSLNWEHPTWSCKRLGYQLILPLLCSFLLLKLWRRWLQKTCCTPHCWDWRPGPCTGCWASACPAPPCRTTPRWSAGSRSHPPRSSPQHQLPWIERGISWWEFHSWLSIQFVPTTVLRPVGQGWSELPLHRLK